MKSQKQKLLLEQTESKIQPFKSLQKDFQIPGRGWIYTLRTALNMSLRQLGKKLNISAQSVNEIELREANGSLTLKSLKEAANALNMELVYALVPKDESIEAMIEKRAYELAKEIVMRTSVSMELEEQGNDASRIQKAIQDKAEEIKNTLPKYLWD